MRALLSHREIAASPGQSFSVELEVSNTSDVIDSGLGFRVGLVRRLQLGLRLRNCHCSPGRVAR